MENVECVNDNETERLAPMVVASPWKDVHIKRRKEEKSLKIPYSIHLDLEFPIYLADLYARTCRLT